MRKDYPALGRKINNKNLVYFDNACAILKPKIVIDSINYYYNNLGGCAGARGTYTLNQETNEICQRARENVAKFLNTSSNQIIWTRNTTESINLLASSLKFKKGDEVIVSNIDHHSNILPFYKQRNVELKSIDIQREFDIETLKQSITPKTKLISLTHASNVTGQILPMKEIIKVAHDKGVLVMSDEAQYVAHKKLDFKKSGVDFAAFSSHKIGGDTGLGVLYVKQGLIKELKNYNVGGGTVKDVKFTNGKFQPEYFSDHSRFEAGLQHYAGIIGMGAAVKQIQKIGFDQIEQIENKLMKKLWEGLENFDFKFLTDKKIKNIPIISFIPNIPAQDFALYMDTECKNHKFCIRAGNHCASPLYYSKNLKPASVRVSLFAYNTENEIQLFVENIKILDALLVD